MKANGDNVISTWLKYANLLYVFFSFSFFFPSSFFFLGLVIVRMVLMATIRLARAAAKTKEEGKKGKEKKILTEDKYVVQVQV